MRVGADTTFYWYNANGELTVRARNNNSGTNVRTIERLFFWDGGQLVAETDAAMTTRYGEYAYLPGADRPLAFITTDSSVSGNTLVRYYQQDELGNVIGLTSGSAVAQQITYEPWGAVAAITGAAGDTSRLRWKGLVWEGGATQLYYVRNRWYDPEARRFVSQDPIGVEGGLNEYAFAGNDPVNGADPLGLNPCPETALEQGWHTVVIDGKTWCYNGGQPLPPVAVTTTPWRSDLRDNFGTRGGLTASQAEQALLGVGWLLTPFKGPAEAVGNIVILPLGGLEEATAAKALPLLGRNARYTSTRALTDLPGGLATAKSIFRRFTRGLEIEQFAYKGNGVRRVAPNGYQIRIEPNGIVRLDVPRGPLGRETVHFWP